MIRKLTEQDREQTLLFLSEEPSINLFIIGDMEAFGFDADFQELWGQFDEKGELDGVLLRFRESYIPYFRHAPFDGSGFQKIITDAPGKIIISGKKSIIDALPELHIDRRQQETYFCELASRQRLPVPDESVMVKIALEADAARIDGLISQIDEFSDNTSSVEAVRHKLATRTGRVYYIENEAGEMVSLAQTTAENSKSAMIVGVATLPDYRGRGYVSQCMIRLCRDVMDEGKTLCLFYDNPKAGSIYHRLGFETIDKWVMLKERP